MELVPYPLFSTHRLWARTLIVGFPLINFIVPFYHWWYPFGMWNPEYDRRIATGHALRLGVIGVYRMSMVPILKGMNRLTPGYKAIYRSRRICSWLAFADLYVMLVYTRMWWIHRSTIRFD